MRKYRSLIYIIIAIIIVAGLWMLMSREKKLSISWTTARIERGDISVNVTATGTLSADTTMAIGTQVSGVINKINVDYNSKVRKGQIIAELDKTSLIANLDDAKANLAKARSTVAQSERDYQRMSKLLNVKAIAQSDYDLALATFESAKATEQSALAQLSRAQINLNYATIVAPISGVVISRAVDVGQTVAASFTTPTLFTIANDLTKMQVQASVDEADIGEVTLGQQVTFTVDAYPSRVFGGKVRQIRLQPTTISNVVTYTVIIEVPNKDMKLMPGMTTSITIHVENHPDILKVQSKALHFNPPKEYYIIKNQPAPDSAKHKKGSSLVNYNIPGSKATIWLKNGQDVHPVDIIIGLSDGNYTEVKGNIKEGDEAAMEAEVTGTAGQARSPFMPQFGKGSKRGM